MLTDRAFPLLDIGNTGTLAMLMRSLRHIIKAALLILPLAVLAQTPPAAAPPKALPIKLEPFLLVPEPKAMRSSIAKPLAGARVTVFTPMREIADGGKLQAYTETEFQKLGIGWDTYLTKAREAADRRLATLQPELIKDEAGRVRYAVYRGEQSWYASLLLAPSLAKTFEKIFGKEIWIAAPDRNALYIFPANAAVVDDFAGDLESRFHSTPYSASEEIFALKVEEVIPRVVGSFTD
jgi:hypothetical protein